MVARTERVESGDAFKDSLWKCINREWHVNITDDLPEELGDSSITAGETRAEHSLGGRVIRASQAPDIEPVSCGFTACSVGGIARR